MTPQSFNEQRDGAATEITKLREQLDVAIEAFNKIKANRYGLQGLLEDGASDKEIRDYWFGTASDYQRIAWDALKRIEEIGRAGGPP